MCGNFYVKERREGDKDMKGIKEWKNGGERTVLMYRRWKKRVGDE
jgi:hypothetical protein